MNPGQGPLSRMAALLEQKAAKLKENNSKNAKPNPFVPLAVKQYGYGASFILGIASALMSFKSDLPSFIILVLLVVLLMCALRFFQKGLQSKYWIVRGIAGFFDILCMAALILGGVAALYLTLTGQLSSVLNPTAQPAPQVTISVTATSAHLTLTPPALPATIFSYELANAEGKILKQIDLGVFKGSGQYVITGLTPATTYTLTFHAKKISWLPLSAHSIYSLTTDAIKFQLKLPFSSGGEWQAFYAGPMTPNGPVASAQAEVTFVSSSREKMLYKGPTAFGLPSGTGSLVGPGLSACPSANFEAGVLKNGQCIIRDVSTEFVRNLKGKARDAIYKGDVVEGTGLPVGPYRVTAHGDGGFYRAEHYADPQERTDKSRALYFGHFDNGHITEGFALTDTLIFETFSGEISRGTFQGPSAKFTTKTFTLSESPLQPSSVFFVISGEIGSFSGSRYTMDYFGNFRSGWNPIQTPDCRYDEYFITKLDKDSMDGLSSRVTLTPVGDNTFRLLFLKSKVAVQTQYFKDQPPAIRIYNDNFDQGFKEMSLSFDGKAKYPLTLSNMPNELAAQEALAKMCFSKSMKDSLSKETESMEGLCPIITLLLARTYSCRD